MNNIIQSHSSLQKRNSKKMTFFFFFNLSLSSITIYLVSHLKVLVALSMPLIFDCFVCLFVNWYANVSTEERERCGGKKASHFVQIFFLSSHWLNQTFLYMAFWKRKGKYFCSFLISFWIWHLLWRFESFEPREWNSGLQ